MYTAGRKVVFLDKFGVWALGIIKNKINESFKVSFVVVPQCMPLIALLTSGLTLKRHVIARACLFTRLMKARHAMPKICNLSLLVFLSSDFLLFQNRSSCFFSFRICGKSCSCGSLCFFLLIVPLLVVQPRIIFSRPSKVEV